MKLGEVDRRCITIPISTIKRTELLFFECSNRSLNNSLLLLQDKNGYEYKKKKLADFWKKRHVREANVLLSHRLRPSTDWATGHRGIPPTPKPTRAISLPFSPFAFLGFSNPPKPYDSNPPNTFDEKLLTKPRNKSRNLEWRHYGIQNSPTISNFCSIPRFFFIKNL